ncbi:MAG: caspase family protein [Myxococcota bacterium]
MWDRLVVFGLAVGLMFGSARARAETPPPIAPPIATGDRASRDAAIVIGNEGYAALPQVVYARQDARAFREWLRTARGMSNYRIRYLEDSEFVPMWKAVQRGARRVRSRGTLWIYYAGHGTAATAEGDRAILGIDANPIDPSSKAMTLPELVEIAQKTRAERVVIVLDAGFGNRGRDRLPLVPDRADPDLGPPPDFGDNTIVWLAQEDATPAAAYVPAQHGMFTYLLLGALRGWADGAQNEDPDGKVTLQEAQRFIDTGAQRLGQVTHPSRDARAAVQDWVLVTGDLEPAPDPNTFRRLSLEARIRRFTDQEDLLKAEVAAFWAETMQLAAEGGEAGRAALEGFIEEYEDAAISVEWAVALPQVEEARQALINYGVQGASMNTSDLVEPCDDLIAIEPAAMMGNISPGQMTCLENRLRTERLQTTKDKISRLLMVDAQNKGDKERWARLMARHLEDIDRSDPDLCFSYAIHLYRATLEDQEESLRWADYALENKQNWEGDEFVKKVTGLYKLRAEASANLWKDAERILARENTPENAEAARDFRGLAMDYAREWLDYARASRSPNIERAYNMCVAAAGTADFCRDR